MAKLRDLTGKRFGRLTVISHFDKNKWGGLIGGCAVVTAGMRKFCMGMN